MCARVAGPASDMKSEPNGEFMRDHSHVEHHLDLEHFTADSQHHTAAGIVELTYLLPYSMNE